MHYGVFVYCTKCSLFPRGVCAFGLILSSRDDFSERDFKESKLQMSLINANFEIALLLNLLLEIQIFFNLDRNIQVLPLLRSFSLR